MRTWSLDVFVRELISRALDRFEAEKKAKDAWDHWHGKQFGLPLDDTPKKTDTYGTFHGVAITPPPGDK